MDLSVINACLLEAPDKTVMALEQEQLVATDAALLAKKSIWEVETGLGKTYIVMGFLNSLLPTIYSEKKKVILVAPSNKVLEFAQLLSNHTMFNVLYSSGVAKEVNNLIANWNKNDVFVVTPSIWGSSIEFNCHVYNHRKEVLCCIWDEADRVNDTGFMIFIELCRKACAYTAFLNATPIGTSASSMKDGFSNNESLRVLYNLVRGIGRWDGSYSSFFSKYTTQVMRGGSKIFLLEFQRLMDDFGGSIINYNREDVGVGVSFSRIDFHRCKITDVQRQALARKMPIRQILYSPETSNAFKLTANAVPALGQLMKIIMTLPMETNKIVYAGFTSSITTVHQFLSSMGYNVFIYDGKTTSTPEEKQRVEKEFNASQGAIVLTNIEKAGNLGSATNVIIYDSPSDVVQYIARSVRGFEKKKITLDWVYYPAEELDRMVDMAERTINNTIQNKRVYELIPPMLAELQSINKHHPKLKLIKELYENYTASRNG